MLFHSKHVNSSRPAIYDATLQQWCTYDELYQMVSGLSISLAWPKKGLVFCFCRRDLGTVAWYLAALESGHAVALIDDGLNDDFKRQLISLYAPDFVVSSVATTDYKAAGYQAQGEGYKKLPIAGTHNFVWQHRSVHERDVHQDLTLLLSTSGSTGSPKFVRLTRSNVISNADSIRQALAINSEERPICSLPLSYSYGLSVLNSHLLAGATVVMTNEGLTSQAFWNQVREAGCTSFAGVPYSYQILKRLNIENLALPTLKVMTQAGGKLSNDLIGYFHDLMSRRKGRFFVMYGQTEATARIAILPSKSLPDKLGSAGIAIPGGTLSLEVDGALTTKAHTSGELVYRGPNVMMGYARNRGDLSQGDVLAGVLRTGDIAHLDDDGFVFIEGRMKRDVKLYGLRVNLDEIENMLRHHGPTAVVGATDRLVIFCEYGDEESLTRQRRELASKLMVNFQAVEFRRVDHIPTQDSGKIDYSKLASQV